MRDTPMPDEEEVTGLYTNTIRYGHSIQIIYKFYWIRSQKRLNFLQDTFGLAGPSPMKKVESYLDFDSEDQNKKAKKGLLDVDTEPDSEDQLPQKKKAKKGLLDVDTEPDSD